MKDAIKIICYSIALALVLFFCVAWLFNHGGESASPGVPRKCVAAVMSAIDAQAELERAAFRVNLECRDEPPKAVVQ